jgi:hypothetical protein
MRLETTMQPNTRLCQFPTGVVALLYLAIGMGVPQSVAQSPEATQAQPKLQQPALKQHDMPQQRSAQGDCVREANRRGFAVLDTGNFRQLKEGWSIDLRVRDRHGRTASGTCFVESRTGEVSLYGFGWGDDWGGQCSIEFVCASVETRYRECQLPVDGRAVLVKRLSDARCVEGQSWGQRRDLVWVDHGCRARFQVTRGGSGNAGGGLIDCNSDNQRYRECPVGAGYTARLVREYSNNRCRRDSTWGTRNGIVWVTSGCRGQFQRVRGSGGGSGSGGGAAAEAACLDEVRRRGYRVSQQYAARPVPGGYRMDLVLQTRPPGMRTATCVYSFNTGLARIDLAGN